MSEASGWSSIAPLFSSMSPKTTSIASPSTFSVAPRPTTKFPSATTVTDIRRGLHGTGLTIGSSLGFNNTYALAVRREMSERLGLRALSDLDVWGYCHIYLN